MIPSQKPADTWRMSRQGFKDSSLAASAGLPKEGSPSLAVPVRSHRAQEAKSAEFAREFGKVHNYVANHNNHIGTFCGRRPHRSADGDWSRHRPCGADCLDTVPRSPCARTALHDAVL